MKKLYIGAVALCLIIQGCGPITNTENNNLIETYQCEVLLEGGSGKATLLSPAVVTVDDEEIDVELIWSSPNYDYMIVDDVQYDNEADIGDNSSFTIPIPDFDQSFTVIADTTAMSAPHEIEYTLTVYSPNNQISIDADDNAIDSRTDNVSLDGLTYVDSLQLDYAKEFTIDYYQDDDGNLYNYICIGSGEQKQEFLQAQSKENEEYDTISVDKTYLVSTSVMDLLAELDVLDNVPLSGTDINNWSVQEAVDAMNEGNMVYAGKYSAPDYELLLSTGCNFAIENTMIYHSPQVIEKLQDLGITVMVERSSYESNPLARLEWIKFYGVLYGKLEQAETFFDEQVKRVNDISSETIGSTQSVAVFSVTSQGLVTVRRPGDYLTSMIEMAGGEYIPSSLQGIDSGNSSSVNITVEEFYEIAKDADYLIYNGTISGDVDTMESLEEELPILSKFNAVLNNNVYCLSQDYFQQTTHMVDLIEEIHGVLMGDATDSFEYLSPID